jgi:beta-glucosidase/6-phospho-beta-glucosidase/beta-galactosidase
MHGSVRQRIHARIHPFMFATGIECSAPVVRGVDGRPLRRDQMAECGHYDRWQEDFQLVKELGLSYLRYGPPYHRTHLAPERYDWSFADATFRELKRLGITPIVDLCHFGVPDWIGDFQNPDWPRLFARYAQAFAERFPWVRLYTPVNEIYVCAKFSALLGWWNERLTSDRGFVTALKHMVQANILAEEAILQVQPGAYFIQSESSEYFHPGHPSVTELAEILNERRFLSLDLLYGYPNIHYKVYEYLLDNGMTREEISWCMQHGRALKPHHIMGTDYYITNEHLVHSDGRVTPSGEIFGYYVITSQYYSRYHLPVMHTETNCGDDEQAVRWLWKEWANMLRLKADGVPILGFTWYSLTDQIDWDTALREYNRRVTPVGLYTLDRKIRPVGEAYKRLVAQWGKILPEESSALTLCLDMEIEEPSG